MSERIQGIEWRSRLTSYNHALIVQHQCFFLIVFFKCLYMQLILFTYWYIPVYSCAIIKVLFVVNSFSRFLKTRERLPESIVFFTSDPRSEALPRVS